MSDFDEDVIELFPWIMRIAKRLCKDIYDAEDLTSETILKMLLNRERYDKERNLKSWSIAIMTNTFKTQYNHRKCLQFVNIDDREIYHSNYNTSDRINTHIMLSLIRQYSRRSCCITSVILYAKGFSYEEISEIERIPIGTVRSRISLGRGILRKAFEL